MNDYWEKRKALLMFEQMEQAEHHAEDIARMHDKAMHYLQRQADKVFDKFKRDYGLTETQADKVFDKFKRDYGLTETQARQLLKSIKSPNDIKELKKALQSKEKNPNIDRLLADLDSSAYAFRINRFEQLQKETDRVLKSLAKTNVRTSKDYYKNFIADSYYKSTYNLQQQSGAGYPFKLLSESEINALMHSNWSGGNYSSRIWKDAESLSKTLKNEFLLSLLTGKSVREVSEAISEKFNSGKFKSRRLVRTESAYFHGQMELKSYEEADVEYYRFVATLDLRTSNLCREQDNKRYKVSDAKVGSNYPPLHPWCRSTTIAADDDWVESRVRSAKDPVTGKTVKVPANMSYQEWYDKYVMSNKTLEKRGTKAYNQSMDSTKRNKDPNKRRPVPKIKQKSLTKAFRARGGLVWQDDEATAYLKLQGADAICLGPDLIVLQKKPTVSEVLEELYHAEQHFRGEIDTNSRRSIVLAEIKAQEYLLSMTEKYNIPKNEVIQTTKALKTYQKELEELNDEK